MKNIIQMTVVLSAFLVSSCSLQSIPFISNFVGPTELRMKAESPILKAYTGAYETYRYPQSGLSIEIPAGSVEKRLEGGVKFIAPGSGATIEIARYKLGMMSVNSSESLKKYEKNGLTYSTHDDYPLSGREDISTLTNYKKGDVVFWKSKIVKLVDEPKMTDSGITASFEELSGQEGGISDAMLDIVGGGYSNLLKNTIGGEFKIDDGTTKRFELKSSGSLSSGKKPEAWKSFSTIVGFAKPDEYNVIEADYKKSILTSFAKKYGKSSEPTDEEMKLYVEKFKNTKPAMVKGAIMYTIIVKGDFVYVVRNKFTNRKFQLSTLNSAGFPNWFFGNIKIGESNTPRAYKAGKLESMYFEIPDDYVSILSESNKIIFRSLFEKRGSENGVIKIEKINGGSFQTDEDYYKWISARSEARTALVKSDWNSMVSGSGSVPEVKSITKSSQNNVAIHESKGISNVFAFERNDGDKEYLINYILVNKESAYEITFKVMGTSQEYMEDFKKFMASIKFLKK